MAVPKKKLGFEGPTKSMFYKHLEECGKSPDALKLIT